MGQRLVVTIQNNEENLCNIYYHWSAYFVSALMETRDIINVLCDDDNEIEDVRLRMIRYVEANGGGVANGKGSDEWKYIQKMYPDEVFKEEGISRNCGLIAISEEGMNNSQYWSEGDVYIDISTDRVTNFVNWHCNDIDALNKNRHEWDDDWKDITLEDIPEIECDLSEFDFTDIDYLIEALDNASDDVVRYGNDIYELIA